MMSDLHIKDRLSEMAVSLNSITKAADIMEALQYIQHLEQESAANLQRALVAEKDAWQPIETIPKDGRLVLLWISASKYQVSEDGENFQEHDVSEVDFGKWHQSSNADELAGYGDGYVENFMGDIGDQYCATHWKPTPIAPDTSTQSTDQQNVSINGGNIDILKPGV